MGIKSKEKNFLSAVVYVRNREKQIADFLKRLDSVLEDNFEKYEIICVNDASTDGTKEQIKSLVEPGKKSAITILNMSFYQGLESSMNAGMDLAIGDFVFEFDTIDMDYSIDTIMQVYRRTMEGHDIVSAAPQSNRGVTSDLFYSVFNKHTNYAYKLKTEAFRVLSRRAINRITSMNKTIPYRKAIYANCGLSCDTIYYTADSKVKSVTEDKKHRRELAIDSLMLFTDVAYKFAVTMTALMMAVTVLVAIYAVAIFAMRIPIAGWTTTILFLAFSFFGLFGILTIVIKYLSILVNLVFKKQKYTFESIEKL